MCRNIKGKRARSASLVPCGERRVVMRAMVLESIGMPLKLVDRLDPIAGPSEIRLKVEACAVCRTVIDGDLRYPKLPLIPGHEIVGIIDSVGKGVARSRIGRRVGVPWLGHTCGHCPYCVADNENLCDQPDFTGYPRDGGFASHVIADAQFAFDLDPDADAVSLAPLLCAGLIGWRCLKKAGDGKRLGIYGFGAAAHIVARSRSGKVVRSSLSPGRVTRKHRNLRDRSARVGQAARMNLRPSSSMPRSSSLPWVAWCRSRLVPSARVAGWFAAAST